MSNDIVFTAYTESEAGMSDETGEESTRMVSLRSKDGKIFSIADYFLKAARFVHSEVSRRRSCLTLKDGVILLQSRV